MKHTKRNQDSTVKGILKIGMGITKNKNSFLISNANERREKNGHPSRTKKATKTKQETDFNAGAEERKRRIKKH
jgi:hypothetical protein